ncbi:MAG TPA: rod shape-determining protein MreC [Opitutales bacterium]|nr:rod shape-determining protein MreC [Opitutales bacterium]
MLVLALFLAVWWLAPVGVRSFSRASFALFEAPGLIGYSHVKDLQDYWSLRDHGQNALIAAGRDVQRHANDDDLRLQQAAAVLAENERLAALLQLPPEPGFRYEVARVIRRDETAWWQQITIRKGRHDGIADGQGVVFAGGVAGRVKQADEYTAVVELVTSPSFRIAAQFGPDGTPVIFEGVTPAPFQNPTGEVHGVMNLDKMDSGQPLQLVSSSLAGSFPQGLALGEVDRLQTGSDGLSQSGVVKLDTRLLNLQEVAVLVPDGTAPVTINPSPATPASGK